MKSEVVGLLESSSKNSSTTTPNVSLKIWREIAALGAGESCAIPTCCQPVTARTCLAAAPSTGRTSGSWSRHTKSRGAPQPTRAGAGVGEGSPIDRKEPPSPGLAVVPLQPSHLTSLISRHICRQRHLRIECPGPPHQALSLAPRRQLTAVMHLPTGSACTIKLSLRGRTEGVSISHTDHQLPPVPTCRAHGGQCPAWLCLRCWPSASTVRAASPGPAADWHLPTSYGELATYSRGKARPKITVVCGVRCRGFGKDVAGGTDGPGSWRGVTDKTMVRWSSMPGTEKTATRGHFSQSRLKSGT